MIWRSTTIKETSLTLKKTNKPKTCHFPDLWGCGILFQLNISLRKIIFEKNKLVNCAHSYCIFYRMVGNLFFLMFRRLCGGRLVMAYFQNNKNGLKIFCGALAEPLAGRCPCAWPGVCILPGP